MTVADELRALIGDEPGAQTEELYEALRYRITVLSSKAWENRVNWDLVERWLENFQGASGQTPDTERLHALFVLSQFLYFGSREIRVLLQALYRDLFLLPLIQEVRTSLGGTRNEAELRNATEFALNRTRFLGVGNPSESGVHLLYFFRQENGLTKDHFLDTAQILERAGPETPTTWKLSFPDVERYVFVDDVCGSGDTAIKYSEGLLAELKGLNKNAKLSYFAMFGTVDGMKAVRENTLFGASTAAVYELDESYKCLSDDSRYLAATPHGIDPAIVRSVGEFYGKTLFPKHPTGFQNAGLLLGFHHNTPDNTIPIIWADQTHGAQSAWTPVFKRYPKI
jgi:hypothetical protein